MNMDCKTSAELVTRVLSGNASSQEETDFRIHLASCASCADVERKLSRTWALMGGLPQISSRKPLPAAPAVRKTVLRSPLWVVGAAAAAVLVVSALAFSLFKPETKSGAPAAPVAKEATTEDARPSEEETRVQNVLTRIDAENPIIVAPPAPAPLVEPVEPPAAPVVKEEPKSAPPAAPEKKDAVVRAPAETRVEDKKAPDAVPAPAPVLPAIATLDRVEGEVFVLSAGKRLAVLSGHKLVAGDALETSGKAGQAVVEFADSTRLVLGADTIVDSIRIAEGKRVSLKQGVLAAQIARQPAHEPMIFLTATAETRVLGTRLTLSVTPASTRLEVREGKVRITRREDNHSVDVSADQVVTCGKGLSMAPKTVTTVRMAMHETFDRPRWGGAWLQGGEPNLGVRMTAENGSLAVKTLQKPAQDLGGSKLPDAARLVQSAATLATMSKKDWPRTAWLESRQAFPFSNEKPVRIRTRTWNSHNDADRISWVAVNRGVAGQGLSLERRGASLQLWVEGASAPAWKKDIAAAQEWETLELWISKDQMVVRRNEETLYAGGNPLKVKAGTLSLGVNAKMELAQDEEVRFDDVDVLLTTKAELDEVSR